MQEHDAGSVFFTDALGALPPALPVDLQQMQFVSVQPGPDHVPVGLFSARPGSSAGVAQDGVEGPGPLIRAEAPLLPSLWLTVLRGATTFSLDVPASFVQIDQLLFRLVMQHHAQSPLLGAASVTVARAHPLRMGFFQEVIWVLSEEESTATVVWDGRHIGQPLQACALLPDDPPLLLAGRWLAGVR